MKHNLLIWGTGRQANVVVEQCRYSNYQMIDDNSIEYLEDSWASIFPFTSWDAFVAIGDNKARQEVTERLKSKGYDLINIVSRDSYISPTVELGTGIYVAPMACIMTHTKIGDGCIVNTNASVDHDCELGNFVHISPCACLGGNVMVGDRTWIGLGSSVIHKIKIGFNVILGAGSAVIEDIKGLKDGSSLYAGNPAVWKKDI